VDRDGVVIPTEAVDRRTSTAPKPYGRVVPHPTIVDRGSTTLRTLRGSEWRFISRKVLVSKTAVATSDPERCAISPIVNEGVLTPKG
jgi:hypothetical protein